jgi:nucleoside-diphosphate-sugar epimerase
MNGQPRRRVVAVTGASGFVGGAVARGLIAAGHDVIAFGRRAPERIDERIRSTYRTWDIEDGPLPDAPHVDAVVHCAGAVDDWGTIEPFRRANVDGTRNVLETWPEARFVHVSSASIYDPFADHSLVHETDAPPEDGELIERTRWLNAYGRTKRETEHVVATIAADRSVILRPHAVYGPDDTQLLPRIMKRRRFGRLLVVGGADVRISVTHIDNFVHATRLAVESDVLGPVNVCDPTVMTVGETLRLMLRALGHEERMTFLPTKPVWAFAHFAELVHLRGRLGIPAPIVTRFQLSHICHDFVMDLTRARDELGYQPPIDAPEGLLTVSLA